MTTLANLSFAQIEAVSETLELLKRRDVETVAADLAELSEKRPDELCPHALAYAYLTEVDGGYSEDEARELAYF